MRAAPAALALAAVMLGACGGSTTVPRDNYYRLMVAPPERPLASPALDGTVEVRRFLADGLMAERALVFSAREEPLSLDRYDYHFWSEPPTRLLQEELVAFLRAAEAAPAVITSEHRAQVDYVITGKIRRFERLIGRGGAAVLVELEFGLASDSGGRLKLVRVYRTEERAADGSLPATVAAFNRAVARVYASFLAEVAGETAR